MDNAVLEMKFPLTGMIASTWCNFWHLADLGHKVRNGEEKNKEQYVA